jgi:hypothetical protein
MQMKLQRETTGGHINTRVVDAESWDIVAEGGL